MTIYPVLKVEVAFQNDPYSTSLTWTDVTRYVRGDVSVKRGRNYERNQNEAGTASLSLENLDGRFSPLNTGSPYAPYVLPYRPIRITAFDGKTTYPIFRGFVERWPQKWAMSGNYGTVDITAVDGMKTVLNKAFGPRYFETLTADAPTDYFRLGETTAAGSSASSASGSTNKLNWQGLAPYTAPTFGLVAGSPDVCARRSAPYSSTVYNNSLLGYVNASSVTVAPQYAGDFAIEFLIRNDVVPTDGSTIYHLLCSSTVGNAGSTLYAYFRSRYPNTGAVYEAQLMDLAGNPIAISLSTAVQPAAGVTHHVAITRIGNTISVFVDGTVIGTTTSTATVWFSNNGGSGGTCFAYLNNAASPQVTYIDEIAYYSAGLTASQVAKRKQAATKPQEFLASDSGSRVSSVLDAVGWPTTMRSVASGGTLSQLQATGSLAGKSGLSVLQSTASDELGNVFVDAAGRACFTARSARNSASAVATLGEGIGEVPYLEGVTVDFDDTYVYNDVEITQFGTSNPTIIKVALDNASNTTYGTRTLPLTVGLASASDCQSQADTLLARYKQPVARLSTLTVDIKANPTVIPQVLPREIGDLVTAKRRPIGAPAITLDTFVDGIEDRISTTAWTRTFLLTPKFANSTY